MSTKPYTALLVSETHWDRAWYLPFESFRIRLVRLIDRVIEILDRDPSFHSFMLDGQMLPIEDYLEIRPERRTDLERLVRAGRLIVGPWYALADEYLVSPEALIRNLLLGLKMARDLAGNEPDCPGVMREGYVPDAFGHINQLPQILQGFGIGSAIFWRGVGDEGEELGNEFWWQAPDGSRVLAVHLPDGYHNASNLGYPMRWGDTSAMEFNMDLALERLRSAVELLKPRAHTQHLLLMNGIDHAEADPRVPSIIAHANRLFPDVEIEHGTLAEFIARVRQAAGERLPVFTGEFNRGRYAVILQGVYSTRMYIKQANERVQTLLEQYAEPLAAWAWVLGTPYPGAFLEHAWRRLMQNHPHDDICGCSVDAVHRENMVRYHDAEQVGRAIARDSFRAMVSHINRRGQAGVPFVVYNPLPWPRTGTVELTLLLDRGGLPSNELCLVDAAGRAMPCQVLAEEEHFEMEVLKANRKRGVRTAVALEEVPACGYRVYFAQAGTPPPATGQAVVPLSNGMENGCLRVEINPDGSLNIWDKRTGHQMRNLGYFADTEDAGDEYDYSPAPHSETISSLGRPAQLRLLHSGPLQVSWEVNLELSLPTALTADRQRRRKTRVNCPVRSVVTLRHDSSVVEVQTEVDNRARDHRLRVCFPTGLVTDHAAAGGHFDVITRPIDLPVTQGWAQPPVPTRHQRGFVDVSDGRVGLAIFSRGLPEYEVLRADGENPGCTIAITLLRCVDAISRAGMLSRPEHAGVPCPTPEAQCLGTHTFEYAICPHAGDWQAIYQAAAEFATPLYVRRGDESEGFLPGEVWPESTPDALLGQVKIKEPDLDGELPPQASFLSVVPTGLLLSAVKRSESGDALIVRLWNPLPRPVEATVRTFWPLRAAQAVNFAEEYQGDVPLADPHTIVLNFQPKQARTVALRL